MIGADCEVVPEVIKALNASGSLTTRFNDDPARASRPWDLARDGNVVGEGAAAILLEAEPHARARKARMYARMDAYQVCASGRNRQYSHDDPEVDIGPCQRAIRSVIEEAGWQPQQVDLVNANGSSSKIYDRIESLAFQSIFGEAFPEIPVTSRRRHVQNVNAIDFVERKHAGATCIRTNQIVIRQVGAVCSGLRRLHVIGAGFQRP